jgi:hypothetical protein
MKRLPPLKIVQNASLGGMMQGILQFFSV